MPISGDYRIDALLRGADYRWNAGLPFGTQTVVSYAFSDVLPAQYQGMPDNVVTGGGSYTYESLNEAHRAIVRSEFAILADAVPGLRFFETPDVNAAVITISAYTPGPDTLGASDANGYVPNGADTLGNLRASGDLWFRSTSTTYDLSYTWNGYQVQPAQFADMVLHEIGHAIGFKHPGNYHNQGTGSEAPPYLPAAEDDSLNTVMSYNGDFAGPNPRPYDLLAGDFLYGSTAPANNLWLLANDGNTVVRGSSLNELILARAASENIDGGAGVDVVRYSGNRGAYAITKTAAGYSIADTAAGGTDTLANVERLSFSDKTIALDLTPTGSAAGDAALLLGAVLGRDLMMSKQPLLGVVIGLLDQGFTSRDLAGAAMRLDIWGVLAGGGSNSEIATYLLRTVTGSTPSASELAAAVSSLSNDRQGDFLWHLAESAANQTQIDLAGLSQTGLEYA
jgi:reprolysin-like metallo-peptidase family M12B